MSNLNHSLQLVRKSHLALEHVELGQMLLGEIFLSAKCWRQRVRSR